jgi:hypothetical protein
MKLIVPLGDERRLHAVKAAGTSLAHYVLRHLRGDWGNLDDEDKQENEFSVQNGYRILSSYRLNGDGQRIWIITEEDRSATTILLPEEY